MFHHYSDKYTYVYTERLVPNSLKHHLQDLDTPQHNLGLLVRQSFTDLLLRRKHNTTVTDCPPWVYIVSYSFRLPSHNTTIHHRSTHVYTVHNANVRTDLHYGLLFNLHKHETDGDASLLRLGSGIEAFGDHTSNNISTSPNRTEQQRYMD